MFALISHYVKKGKLCFHDGTALDQEPISLGSSCLMLHPTSINKLPCITDVGIVIILGEEGVEHSPFIRVLDHSRVDHMLARVHTQHVP